MEINYEIAINSDEQIFKMIKQKVMNEELLALILMFSMPAMLNKRYLMQKH